MNLRHVTLKPVPPAVSFGLVADIQYADKETQKERRYSESLDKLARCVADWNTQTLDFAIQLGDIIDGRASDAATRKDLDDVLNICNRLDVKLRHVVGNHCLRVDRDELLQRLGLAEGYYDFTHANWRFVVLDTMDVSILGRPEDSQAYQAARRYLDSHPKAADFNGAVSEDQKKWLRDTLAEARQANQPVIVFSHLPVVEAASRAGLLAWNHGEITDMLEDAGCVVACFTGHDHKGGYALQNGVHHVTVEGMVEAPTDGNAYATVLLYDDRIVIRGNGTCTSRTLALDSDRKN